MNGLRLRFEFIKELSFDFPPLQYSLSLMQDLHQSHLKVGNISDYRYPLEIVSDQLI